MHYYGVRSCKCKPEEDLGIKYFSSSKYLTKEIQELGAEYYKFKIVKRFDNREDADKYEIMLHAKFDVARNEKFYNKAKRLNYKFSTYGIQLTEEWKEAVRLAGIGRKHSEETKLRMSEQRKKYFEEHPEAIVAMSERGKNRKLSSEARRKISEASKAMWQNEELVNKMMTKKRESMARPDVREKIGAKSKERMNDPERKKFYRKMLSPMSKRNWMDPVYREKMMNVIKASNEKRKNVPRPEEVKQKMSYGQLISVMIRKQRSIAISEYCEC